MTKTFYFQRKSEVLKRLPLSKSTLYTRIKEGTFPYPCSLGNRAVAWPSTEIDALLNAMAAGKSVDELRELVTDLIAQRKNIA